MPKRTQSYDAWQLDRLSHPSAAASFLNAALADSQEMFLMALRKVAQAREMASVAKEAGIQRETLYHALSEQGNPTLETLRGIYDALGLKMITVAKEREIMTPPTSPESILHGWASSLTNLGSRKVSSPTTKTSWFSDGNTLNLSTFVYPAPPIRVVEESPIPPTMTGAFDRLDSTSSPSQYWDEVWDRKQKNEVAA